MIKIPNWQNLLACGVPASTVSNMASSAGGAKGQARKRVHWSDNIAEDTKSANVSMKGKRHPKVTYDVSGSANEVLGSKLLSALDSTSWCVTSFSAKQIKAGCIQNRWIAVN